MRKDKQASHRVAQWARLSFVPSLSLCRCSLLPCVVHVQPSYGTWRLTTPSILRITSLITTVGARPSRSFRWIMCTTKRDDGSADSAASCACCSRMEHSTRSALTCTHAQQQQNADRWLTRVVGSSVQDIGYGSSSNIPDRGAALEKAKKVGHEHITMRVWTRAKCFLLIRRICCRVVGGRFGCTQAHAASVRKWTRKLHLR